MLLERKHPFEADGKLGILSCNVEFKENSPESE